MELSERLYAVAGLVTEGASVADIGTDHGYIPIYLLRHQIAKRVIALDVNPAPLARAEIHIADAGLSGRIETRLSDGLKRIEPGEVDTIIAAGMGGRLVIRILEESREVVDTLGACILQPQSEIAEVRRYLVGHGMRIAAEDMVYEEGKYYSVMKAVHGRDKAYKEWEYIYGRCLLEEKNPVLRHFLIREMKIRRDILKELKKNGGRKSVKRMEEIETEIWYAKKAYACIEQVK